MKIESSACAKVPPQLFRELLLPLDPLAVTGRRELAHTLLSKRRSRISSQQLPQLIKFQNALAKVRNWAGRVHRRCFLWYRRQNLCLRDHFRPVQALTTIHTLGAGVTTAPAPSADTLIRRILGGLEASTASSDIAHPLPQSLRASQESLPDVRRGIMAAHSDAFVFFGATGDLAHKKIFPALQNMVRQGTSTCQLSA